MEHRQSLHDPCERLAANRRRRKTAKYAANVRKIEPAANSKVCHNAWQDEVIAVTLGAMEGIAGQPCRSQESSWPHT
jgi:hypothetical protein